MTRNEENPTSTCARGLSSCDLQGVHGGSGSNTVFVRRNGETGILRPLVDEVMGGMTGGTGVGSRHD
jgi:hypothetical protein